LPDEWRTNAEANTSSDESVIVLPPPVASLPATTVNRTGEDDDSSFGRTPPEQGNEEMILTPQSGKHAASTEDGGNEEEAPDTQESSRRSPSNQEEGNEFEDSGPSPADLAPDLNVAQTKIANKPVDLTGEDTDQDSFRTPGGSVTPNGNQTGDEGEGESIFSDFTEPKNSSEPVAATEAVDLTGEETESDVDVVSQAAASTDQTRTNTESTPISSMLKRGENAADTGSEPQTNVSEGGDVDKEGKRTPVSPGDVNKAPQASSNVDDDATTLLPKMAAMLPPLKPEEYDTLLPTTPRGILIKLKHSLQSGTTSFNGYNRLEDNVKGPAELQDLCGNVGDQIIAIDGVSMLGTPGPEIIKALIAKGENKHVHLRFRGRMSQSSAAISLNQSEGERASVKEGEEAVGAKEAMLPAVVSLPTIDSKISAEIGQRETQPVGLSISSPTKPPSPTKEKSAGVVGMEANSAAVEQSKITDDSLGQKASQPSSSIPSKEFGFDDSEKAPSHECSSKISSGNQSDDASAPHRGALFKAPTSTDPADEEHILHSIIGDLPPLVFGEYDSLLPTTSKGIMITVKSNMDGTATFLRYTQFPNGLRGPSEMQNLCRNIGDRLIAVDGISVLEKSNGAIVEMLKEKSKNKHVHIRFRPQDLLSATAPHTSPAKPPPMKDSLILATEIAVGDADQKERSKHKTVSEAGSPVQVFKPSKREELQSSPEALAMLAVLQNESGVTLISPLAQPRKIELTHTSADSFKPRAIEGSSALTVSAPYHSPPALLAPPVDHLYNNVSTTTSDKRGSTDDAPLRLAAPASSSRDRSTKSNASKSVSVSHNIAPPKRRRLHASKLTGQKVHMLQAKWSNDYEERDFEDAIAVTYAMQLDNLTQQEQARQLLAADNQRYRRAQERKKASTTAQRGKRPPPVARTAATTKRRKQTGKQTPVVDPNNDSTDKRDAADTAWTPYSGKGSAGGSKKPASPKQPPKMVYEGPPTNVGPSCGNNWPSSWGNTWPDGWTMRTFERRGGATKGTTDRYWYSPTNKKLRSMLAVKRFAEATAVCGGDEEKAWVLLREKSR
jgi:hypothetical protein